MFAGWKMGAVLPLIQQTNTKPWRYRGPQAEGEVEGHKRKEICWFSYYITGTIAPSFLRKHYCFLYHMGRKLGQREIM